VILCALPRFQNIANHRKGATRPLAHARSPLWGALAKHPADPPEQHKCAACAGVGELFDLWV